MKRREFLALTAAAAFCSALKPVFADGAKKKILYFDRSTSYIHPSTKIEDSTGLSVGGRVITEIGKKLGFEVVCTKDGRVFDGDLSQYAAFMLNCCGQLTGNGGGDGPNAFPMSKEGEQNFYAAVRAGAGVMGFHNATDTNHSGGPSRFENCPIEKRNDYTNMMGGEFIVHGSQQETDIRIVKKGELPSVTEIPRVKEEWYALKNFNPDIHVLFVQETDGMQKEGGNVCYDRPAYPCTWVRKEGNGRVAYTSLAHNNSTWETDWMQAVIFDLMKFITGQMDLDLTPNMNAAAPGCDVACRQNVK